MSRVRSTVLHGVVWFAVFAALFIGAANQADSRDVAGPDVMDHRPHADGSPVALIEAHGCWTGTGPEGVIPGHVVVTREDAVAATYGGDHLTDMALEQVFDGADHGLTVHAFCR